MTFIYRCKIDQGVREGLGSFKILESDFIYTEVKLDHEGHSILGSTEFIELNRLSFSKSQAIE